MTRLVICAAQYCSVAGDINLNIDRHLQLMRRAAEHEVQFLLFPELSLTGYEPSLAQALAQAPDTERLQPLRELAVQSGMTTVVGLPLRYPGSENILIGAVVMAADGSQCVYTKQHLHPGEELVFSAGEGGALVGIDAGQIALSVCADFTHHLHAKAAAQAGATVYASSVLISHEGYARDTALLEGYAREHSMGVLMANHGGPSGRSAFWLAGGDVVISAPGEGNCLVIAHRQKGVWQGQVVECSALG